jgi:hypothetical protein
MCITSPHHLKTWEQHPNPAVVTLKINRKSKRSRHEEFAPTHVTCRNCLWTMPCTLYNQLVCHRGQMIFVFKNKHGLERTHCIRVRLDSALWRVQFQPWYICAHAKALPTSLGSRTKVFVQMALLRRSMLGDTRNKSSPTNNLPSQ